MQKFGITLCSQKFDTRGYHTFWDHIKTKICNFIFSVHEPAAHDVFFLYKHYLFFLFNSTIKSLHLFKYGFIMSLLKNLRMFA